MDSAILNVSEVTRRLEEESSLTRKTRPDVNDRPIMINKINIYILKRVAAMIFPDLSINDKHPV